jgi:A/G-specific adenine glycosylase
VSPRRAPPSGPPTFAARLLRWYDREKRRLPWRDLGNPWGTWVSEIMLQQTRAEVVREAFPRFLASYPTPAAWASAGDDELLVAWRGLGYYRRARLLRDGARAVVSRHGGAVPGDLDALGELPGVGAYTRGAIASIAFGLPVPAIDGNVERVFARHRGIAVNVKTAAGAKAIAAAAQRELDPARAGDFNQALMDLGARVCTPRSPACPNCPVNDDCVARQTGRQAELPVLPAPKAAVAVLTRVALVQLSDGRTLGQRVAAGAINAGQVDLPGPGPLVEVAETQDLQAWLDAQLGEAAVRVAPEALGEARHGITHHRIKIAVHRGTLATRRLPAPFVLAPLDDPATPWTTIARKAARLAAPARAADRRTLDA